MKSKYKNCGVASTTVTLIGSILVGLGLGGIVFFSKNNLNSGGKENILAQAAAPPQPVISSFTSSAYQGNVSTDQPVVFKVAFSNTHHLNILFICPSGIEVVDNPDSSAVVETCGKEITIAIPTYKNILNEFLYIYKFHNSTTDLYNSNVVVKLIAYEDEAGMTATEKSLVVTIIPHTGFIVDLDDSTPPSRSVTTPATDVPFLAVRLRGINFNRSIPVSSICVFLKSDASPNQFGDVSFWDGNTLLGKAKFEPVMYGQILKPFLLSKLFSIANAALNDYSACVSSKTELLTIPALGSKVITIKANILEVSQSINTQFSISAFGITASDGTPVSGLPVEGRIIILTPPTAAQPLPMKILSPNGGERIQQGANNLIQWTGVDLGMAYIYLIDNSNNEAVGCIQNGVKFSSVGQQLYWDGNSVSSNCEFINGADKVVAPGSYKILILTTDGRKDTSDAPFIIVSATPLITVLSPSGGNLTKDSTFTIQWVSNNYPAAKRVNIELVGFTNGIINNYQRAIAIGVPNDGSETWTIPANIPTGTQYTYKVVIDCYGPDSATTGCGGIASLIPFTIMAPVITTAVQPTAKHQLILPNGGEIWNTGERHTIFWSNYRNGTVQILLFPWAVKTEITTKAYSPTAIIAMSAQDRGSFDWLIPSSIPSGKYFVRIFCTDVPCFTSGTSGIEDSENPFTIVPVATPSITVLAPKGGESFIIPAGSYYSSNVIWSYSNLAIGNAIRVTLDQASGKTEDIVYENTVSDITNTHDMIYTLPRNIPSGSYRITAKVFRNKYNEDTIAVNQSAPFTIFTILSDTTSNNLLVNLDVSNPVSKTIITPANGVPFLALNLKNNDNTNSVSVYRICIRLLGTADLSNFGDISFWDSGIFLGKSKFQSMELMGKNTASQYLLTYLLPVAKAAGGDGLVCIGGSNAGLFTVSGGKSRVITIKADISPVNQNVTAQFSVHSVEILNGKAVEGLPMNGNVMTIVSSTTVLPPAVTSIPSSTSAPTPATASTSTETNDISAIQQKINLIFELIKKLQEQIESQKQSQLNIPSAPAQPVPVITVIPETKPSELGLTGEETETFSYTWNNDLYYGLTNNKDVQALQNALTIEKCYTGPVTGSFFKLTRAGVICFQKKHNFASIPNIGYVGPYTRKVLNDLYSR